jgi:hypothetical protein
MDNVASWFSLLVLLLCGAVFFAKYALISYEQYLENRRHGWQ